MVLKINPREYQKKIFEVCKDKNALVILPTGLGKTLIALMLSIESLKKFPLKKILFLAPTRPLVEQHYEYYKKHLPELYADLQLFTGSVKVDERRKIFQTAEIIFSTPQCIANDLKNNVYDLKEISLLVMDECHRCLKNYDYTTVVSYYKQQSENRHILGLTASPGSDKNKIEEICNHLDIEEIEVRTRESDDVKSYLQELNYETLEVEFPKEFIEIQVLLKRIFNSMVEKLRMRNLLFAPANKITLLKLQSTLAIRAAQNDFNAMLGMSLTAQAIKISHALELLETQTLSGLNEYLKSMQKQAAEKKSKAVQNMVNLPEFKAAMISIEKLISENIEHPKVDEISKLVEKEFENKIDSKIIIFTQFRETATTLTKRLNNNPKVKASIFIGQTKKANIGFSQKEQKEVISSFKEGKINVLCATSIGEEGLDIPEVSAVIFYEPIPSAIRKIQRTGRTARLAPGKLIILITKDTRDVTNHYASGAKEKKMYRIIDSIKRELKSKSSYTTLNKFIK